MSGKPVSGQFPYEQLQNTTVTVAKPAYSITASPLPSHIRSLCPKHDTSVRVTLNNTDGTARSYVTTKVVYVILVLIFLVSSTIAVMVAILEVKAILRQSSSLSSVSEMLESDPSARYKNSSGYSIKQASAVSGIDFITLLTQDNRDRKHCIEDCLVYTHPDFRASCDQGYCVCEGSQFQRKTCLPSVDGCIVSSRPSPLARASMSGRPSTVYSCNSNKDTWTQVYLISIYGNHFARETVVNIIGDSHKGVTVVLASHYSIRWKLKYESAKLNDVILISDRNTNSAVRLETSSPRPDDGRPKLRSYLLPVGYGPDQYNPYTVRMLQEVGRHFGTINYFIGTDYADFITLTVPST